MQTPAVSIIVISYNTREMTIECLRSVFAETTLPFEIVVVDNASTDGSAEAISEAFPADVYPNLTLLKEIKNHGFAPAHSVALPHCKAPWLLLLNPDTVILDKAIDNLFAFAHREPEARIWGGANSLRGQDAKFHLMLAPHDAVDHLLPNRRYDRAIPRLRGIQPRSLW